MDHVIEILLGAALAISLISRPWGVTHLTRRRADAWREASLAWEKIAKQEAATRAEWQTTAARFEGIANEALAEVRHLQDLLIEAKTHG